jgi:hypothetical protein
MSDYKDGREVRPLVLAQYGAPHIVADGGIDPDIVDDRITFRKPLPQAYKAAWCAAANGVNEGWSLTKFDTPLTGRIIAQVFEHWEPYNTMYSETFNEGHFR